MTAAFEASRVRALLFDIDGTLADTDNAAVAKLAGWLEPLAFRWPALRPEPAARRTLMALETPINALYALWDRLYLDELTAPLSKLLPKPNVALGSVRLVPGVRDMLERAGQRFPMAVVTARGAYSTLAFLEAAHLSDHFTSVVSTRSARRAKPHPAPVLRAARDLKVPPEACLMVGDTTLDVRAGRAAGAQTAAVLCGFGTRDELERAGAHLILDSTADLLDHLPSSG